MQCYINFEVIMFIIVVLGVVFDSVLCDVDVPVIDTTYGPVRGVYETDEYGEYYMYMGIPYARVQPDNYFAEAIDPIPWTDILDANDESAICPQREKFNSTLKGNLDCLKINVYMPANRRTSDPLPVLYWIYGGGFINGHNGRQTNGPEYLVRHEIILVTVNYRLGAYGFLCLGNERIPGNAGIKDTVKGLKWVIDNIENFGGDPNQITVGGYSAGGFIATLYSYSPITEGMFKRLINQSGMTITYDPSISSYNLFTIASRLGYNGSSIDGAIDILQKHNPQDVVAASDNLTFFYCVENDIDGVEAFITREHQISLVEGNFDAVDTLIGFSDQEMLLNWNGVDVDETYTIESMNVLKDFVFNNDHDKAKIEYIIDKFYFKDNDKTNDIIYDYIALDSDVTFIYAIHRAINYIVKKDVNVYLYMFAYVGGRSLTRILSGITLDGAMHADEIGYIFKHSFFDGMPMDDTDQLTIDRLTTMWANFVKYGNPTPEETELVPVTWLPVDSDKRYCLVINNTLALTTRPFNERMLLWDLIFKSYYKPPLLSSGVKSLSASVLVNLITLIGILSQLNQLWYMEIKE